MSTGSISRESLMIIRCFSLRPAEEAVVRVSLISDSFFVTWKAGALGQWPGWWQFMITHLVVPSPVLYSTLDLLDWFFYLSLSYPLHCPWWYCFQWAINVMRISEYHLLNEIMFVSQFCFEDISSLPRPLFFARSRLYFGFHCFRFYCVRILEPSLCIKGTFKYYIIRGGVGVENTETENPYF